jgi:hypothetical protein
LAGAAALMISCTAVSRADPPAPGRARSGDEGFPWPSLQALLDRMPVTDAAPQQQEQQERQAQQQRVVVYLHRDGLLLESGEVDDARTNRSTTRYVHGIDRGPIRVSSYPGSDAEWSQVAACVAHGLAPFDVQVVDERPPEGDYLMVLFGGTSAGIAHDSPRERLWGLSMGGCQPRRNGIVHVFSETIGANPIANCSVALHEIGHAFSLEHVELAADPMSPGSLATTFVDRSAPVGSHSEEPWSCGHASQNSYRRLLELLGPAPPAGALALPVIRNGRYRALGASLGQR